MRLAAFLSCVLALLVATPAAGATYDPVGGGATTLKLDPSFRTLLAENGVKLAVKGGVRIKGARVNFPISGGQLDPLAARGTVDHPGSLVFVAGKRKLPLRALVLKPAQASSPLSAKFGGGQLKIASSARLSSRRAGFGLRADVHRMELSAKVATRLGKKLRLRGVFHEGQALGSAVTDAQPASVAILPSGRATLVPDPAFLAKLNELFVSLNPVSPAELAPGPQLTFPIAAGGSLAPDASAGILKLGGAVEFLQLGGGQIFWAEPVFDLGTDLGAAEVDFQPSPPYPGKLGPVPILGLGAPAAAASEPTPRRISIGGAPLALTAETGAAFNQAFGKPQGRDDAFHSGEMLGALSFTAQAQ
jgi:hypothetical protein